MPLFVLAETPAGYGLFKATDKKLLERSELTTAPTTSEKINEMLKLKKFVKFDSSAVAVAEAEALREGKVPSILANLLNEIKDEKKATLAVADLKLGNAISKLPQFNITAVADAASMDLFRAVRENLSSLIPGLLPETVDRMALGLSHSISRHKLKFSADKIDAMIIQAIKLLDDLDKELNVYAMRTKEWYGWHFPELAKILNDNLAYARVVVAVGMRSDFSDADLSDVLPEELETPVKTAAEISMGTEITEEDLDNIQLLAQQVITYSDYRTQLSSYLETRMRAIAPNLTALVGYLVGARLIAHAGSLLNLAKAPSSTIQIFGAEKALFRALKTKHDTPKYGIIYHSSLVGQATGKNKGKIARSLAAKTSLGLRIDALTEEVEGQELDEEERGIHGLTSRIKLENLLRKMEGKPLLPKGVGVGPDGQITAPGQFTLKEVRKYNADADGVADADVNGKAGKKLKEKKSKETLKRPLIEEVDEEMKDAESDSDEEDDEDDEDEEMEDAVAGNGVAAPGSPTLASVSDDSEDIPESPKDQWQSSIEGATREAKKARKKERHERNLELSESRTAARAARNAQLARREDREERRWQKAEQLKQRSGKSPAAPAAPKVEKSKAPKLTEADYERFAALADISVSKFKRKYERGDVELNDDGTPVVYSKKELKKIRKAEEKSKLKAGKAEETPVKAAAADGKKKRKLEDDETPKKEKKHKKKRTSLGA